MFSPAQMPQKRIEQPRPAFRALTSYAFIGRLLHGTERITSELQRRAETHTLLTANDCLVVPFMPIATFPAHRDHTSTVLKAASRRLGMAYDVEPELVTLEDTAATPRQSNQQDLFDVHLPIAAPSALSLKSEMDCVRTTLGFKSTTPKPAIELLVGVPENIANTVAQHVGELFQRSWCLSPPDIYIAWA